MRASRVMAGLVLAISASVLVTCRVPEPNLAANAERAAAEIIARNVSMLDGTTVVLRFEPPPIYAMWRAEVELCSGLRRDGAPTFWLAPVLILNRGGAIGMYIREQRRIVFGLGSESIAWIVRHELLHDMVVSAKTIEESHPHKYFVELCGPLVYPVAP